MLSKEVLRNKSGIYKITNMITNNFYIGSSVNIYNRKHTHKNKLKNKIHVNKHLQNAYLKYGKNNFIFEVIEYCNKEELTSKEQYYIDMLKPYYNKRFKVDTNYGLSISDETKLKISNTLKDKYKNKLIVPYKQTHRNKQVEQYDLNGNYLATYNSAREAEILLNLNYGEVCKGVKLNSYQRSGFQWKYKESDKLIYKKDKHHNSIKIEVIDIKLNTINEYNNVKDFCNICNLSTSSVRKAIKGNYIYLNRYKIKQKRVQYKLDELLEKPEVVNQQLNFSNLQII